MNDERFERELRGFLAERAPGTAGPALRARLHAVTAAPTAGAGVLGRWLGGAGRTVVGVASVGVAAALLILLLTRPQTGVVRDPGTVGGPSAAPAVPQVPFVSAPATLFSAAAIADADRRLAAVYQASGIEGRIIVQAEASGTALSTPAGWPDRYDTDGNDDLDISAVFGVAPDGTVNCCLIDKGSLIERAQQEMYWRPQTWPDRLKADLESNDPAVRDGALSRFVDGIEGLNDGMPFTRDAISREAIVGQSLVLLAIAVLAATLFLTRSRWSGRRMRLSTDTGGGSDRMSEPVASDTGNDLASELAVATAFGTETVRVDAVLGDAARDQAVTVAWTPATATAMPRDRIPLAAAIGALAGFVGLGLVDVLRPPADVVPMEVGASAVGLANAAVPVVPITLLGLAAVAIAMLVQGRGRAGRVAILGLVASVALVGGSAIFNSRPDADSDQHSWVAGFGAGPVEHFGPYSMSDAVTYPVRPDEPFTFASTVRNPGPLPITILGLDGVQGTEPNPFVASIVGLGWVVQPVDDGTIHVLSGMPADASVAWPITLAPGEELGIVLLGRGGPCASPEGTAGNLPIMWVKVIYRVLGIERSEAVGLPAAILIHAKTPCTVKQADGGFITYYEP